MKKIKKSQPSQPGRPAKPKKAPHGLPGGQADEHVRGGGEGGAGGAAAAAAPPLRRLWPLRARSEAVATAGRADSDGGRHGGAAEDRRPSSPRLAQRLAMAEFQARRLTVEAV